MLSIAARWALFGRTIVSAFATMALSFHAIAESSEKAVQKALSKTLSKQAPIIVYSSRKEHLIKPLFDLYQKKTGVSIQYITGEDGPLIERLKQEGKNSPADVLITVDAGNLWHAAERGLLKSIESPVLEKNVPAYLQDSANRWFALTKRARTIVYATDRVDPKELSTYEDLADKKWRGRLCLRTSKKVYNQSLVATLIEAQGLQAAEAVVKGWVQNLAAEVFASDTIALEAVAAGQCDVTIVNTYYFSRLQKTKPNLKLAVFWPNQKDRGVHINVSGAGVTQSSRQPEKAQKLIEWLSGSEAQKIFVELNQEYPVNPRVSVAPELAAWGTFKEDHANIETAGANQKLAIQLMDRAGYR